MVSLESCFTETTLRREGVLYSAATQQALDAQEVWSPLAEADPVSAAAASDSGQDFAKFPLWVRDHFDGGVRTLLDAGCGYGRVAIPLLMSNPGLLCLGVDATLPMLSKFARLAERHEVSGRVALYQGDLRRLPLQGGFFDRILSCAVLLHLPYSQTEEVVRELHRLLKPGGRLILAGAFPNLWNLEGLQNCVFERFHSRRNGPVRVYTRSRVRGLLSGFARVDISSHQVLLLPRHLGRLQLPFGSAIRAVNRKATGLLLGRLERTGLLVTHHEVVAVK